MNRVLVVVLLLGVLAGAAWLLMGDGADAPTTLTDTEARDPAAEPGPVLVAGAARAPPQEDTSRAPSPDAVPTGTGTAADRQETLTLRGHLLGWDRTLEGTLTLQVVRSDGEPPARSWSVPAELPLADDLRFSADISALVAAGPGDLVVTVDHPAYVRHIVRLHSGEAKDGQLLVALTLQPAAGIRGRLEDERGQPMPGADVGVFPLRDRRPEGKPSEATKSTADGTFLLRVGTRGRYLVAACSLDHQPHSMEVEVSAGSAVDLGVLTLRAGLTIEGTVRYRGEPLAKAVLDLAHVDDKHRLSLGAGGLLWKAGRLHPYYRQATAADDGRYAFHGLTKATYSVVVSGGEAFVLHFDDVRYEDGGRKVHAPARAIDFDVDALRLVAEFRCDGKPLPDLKVWLNSLVEQAGLPEDSFGVFGYHKATTDKDGLVTVHLSPGQRYMFGVNSEAHEADTPHFLTPTSGRDHTRVIEVKRKPPRPTLAVQLAGPGAEQLKRAGFGFYALQQDSNPLNTATYISNAVCTNGACVLEDLPPGRWTLHTRPGRDWHQGFSYYVESQQLVDLPRSGATEVRVPVRVGGTLRLSVKDASGRFLGPRCTLTDPRGAQLATDFMVRSEQGITISLGSLLAGAPNRLVQVLAPGTYELRLLADGYLSKTVEVRIRAKETTHLETVLDPIR